MPRHCADANDYLAGLPVGYCTAHDAAHFTRHARRRHQEAAAQHGRASCLPEEAHGTPPLRKPAASSARHIKLPGNTATTPAMRYLLGRDSRTGLPRDGHLPRRRHIDFALLDSHRITRARFSRQRKCHIIARTEAPIPRLVMVSMERRHRPAG